MAQEQRHLQRQRGRVLHLQAHPWTFLGKLATDEQKDNINLQLFLVTLSKESSRKSLGSFSLIEQEMRLGFTQLNVVISTDGGQTRRLALHQSTSVVLMLPLPCQERG